jgi:hypothetical protein
MELRCSDCGASVTAACECGVPYITAGEYAARAIARNPEKSDRLIEEETGVSARTLSRVRKKTTAANAAVKKRKGKDGKERRLPEQRKPPEFPPDVQWEGSLIQLATFIENMDKEWSSRFGNWRRFTMSTCTYELIKRAANTWNAFVESAKPTNQGESNVVQIKQRSEKVHL